MIATLAGLAVSVSGLVLPDAVALALKMLGDVSVPLLLFRWGAHCRGVVGGGSWACWAADRPASGLAMAAAMVAWLPLPAAQQPWLWLFAALPPAVLNFWWPSNTGRSPGWLRWC